MYLVRLRLILILRVVLSYKVSEVVRYKALAFIVLKAAVIVFLGVLNAFIRVVHDHYFVFCILIFVLI